jgi:hypothetical protein
LVSYAVLYHMRPRETVAWVRQIACTFSLWTLLDHVFDVIARVACDWLPFIMKLVSRALLSCSVGVNKLYNYLSAQPVNLDHVDFFFLQI